MAGRKKAAKRPGSSEVVLKKSAARKKSANKKSASRISSPGGRATIKSVAEHAGVSIATVSFVLNDRPGQVISGPVKKRVLEAARVLNYSPSAAAATLARKQTTNVAIVFYRNDHLITNQFYSFVVQGAIKEAAEREFNILFSFMHDEYETVRDLPKVIRENNAAGVLFMQSVSPALVEDIREKGLAMVAVDCYPHVRGLDTVDVDNQGGARLACAHLLDLGHEDIVMLTAPSDIPSLEDRKVGFLSELVARGIKTSAQQAIIKADQFDFFSGYEKTRELLRARPSVTGIFCANDEMAAGALRAAHEEGRAVPDSLSVIGFDDIIMSLYVDPPLSTISFDKEAMGRLAMARLLQSVTQPTGGVARETLGVELVVRGSTGPLPRVRGASRDKRPRRRL